MARHELKENITPEVGDMFVNIPITIDSKPGRGGRFRGQMIANAVVVFIWFFILITTVKNGELTFFTKIFRLLFFTVLALFLIRFVIMREVKLRKQYAKLEDSDYKLNLSSLWGIYGQSEDYPTIFYATGDRLITVIKLQKDVTMGKKEIDLYNHYEAISDALNYAGKADLRVMHVDYMDSVGNDDRLDLWYNEVIETKNPDFKEFFSLMHNHLVESVKGNMSFEDVYVLSSKDTESLFAYKCEQFAVKLKNANFTAFKYYGKEDLQNLICSIYNIHEFSFNEASQGVFNKAELGNITPIEVVSNGIYTKLNLTKEERIQKAKEEEALKEKNKKNKKPEEVKKEKEEDLDIF